MAFSGMPKALPVDHEKIKMVALQIGVREAARRFGLKEATVQAWSDREGWFALKAEVEAIIAEHVEEMGMQPVATKTPSEAISEYRGETKLALAHALALTAKDLEQEKPDKRIKNTQALLNTTSAWAKLHQESENTTHTAFQLNAQIVVVQG
jgi:hypothetical protein